MSNDFFSCFSQKSYKGTKKSRNVQIYLCFSKRENNQADTNAVISISAHKKRTCQ